MSKKRKISRHTQEQTPCRPRPLACVVASSVILAVVLLAFSSQAYRRLTQSYDEA